MKRRVIIAALIALEVLRPGAAHAAEAPSDTGAEQQEQALHRRDRLWAESQRLHAEGKPGEAAAAAEEVVAIERRLLGKGHEDLAVSLDHLGALYAELGRFDDARAAYREALAILEGRYAASHWKVIDARLALSDLDRLAELEPLRARLRMLSTTSGSILCPARYSANTASCQAASSRARSNTGTSRNSPCGANSETLDVGLISCWQKL